jgi:hypothetical protein
MEDLVAVFSKPIVVGGEVDIWALMASIRIEIFIFIGDQ